MNSLTKISRGIILNNNKILLIHRSKKGKDYYVLPGGHVKANESEEEALIREIKEETNLNIKINKKLWSFRNTFDNSLNVIFLITEFSNLKNIKLGFPEQHRVSKENNYILEWQDLNNILNLNLVPEIIKKKIKDFF